MLFALGSSFWSGVQDLLLFFTQAIVVLLLVSVSAVVVGVVIMALASVIVSIFSEIEHALKKKWGGE